MMDKTLAEEKAAEGKTEERSEERIEKRTKAKEELNYYILFANYTHGLALQEMLKKENLPARIAPTPRSIQGELSCGMSLLVKQEHIAAVRDFLERSGAEYHSVVEMPCQIRPHRNRFC